MGTQLREVESGFRYTPTTTFETFPFPATDRRGECANGSGGAGSSMRCAWAG